MKMSNFKFNTAEWDRLDEDRWISASLTTILILVFTFFVMHNLKIPENPEKVIPPEIIEFVPEVKKPIEVKKVVEETKTTVEKKEVVDNPEAALELFKSRHDKIPQFSEQMPISDMVRKFEKENPNVTQSAAKTEIPKGYMYEQSDFEPMDVVEGLKSVDDNENIKSYTINPNPSKTSGIKASEGISTRVAANQEDLSTDFAGFSGQLKWDDWMDPLLDWIRDHPSKIYDVAETQMNVQSHDNTAKTIISIGGKKYELLLASKQGKRQLTMCLIELETNRYMMLIDQGLKQTSNYFNLGHISRKDDDEIIDFTGKTRPASDPEAIKFTKIFWQWANSVTKKG